jgi:hypothetical protein
MRFFRISILCAISWTFVMRIFSPRNIVQFELAETTSTAAAIITAWGSDGVAMAKTSTYLDFIYIIFYSAAIALGCSVAARYSKSPFLNNVAIIFLILTLLAGGCDVIENIAMLKSLHEVTQTTVSVAYYFASVKFSILFTALIFMLVAFATGTLKRISK